MRAILPTLLVNVWRAEALGAIGVGVGVASTLVVAKPGMSRALESDEFEEVFTDAAIGLELADVRFSLFFLPISLPFFRVLFRSCEFPFRASSLCVDYAYVCLCACLRVDFGRFHHFRRPNSSPKSRQRDGRRFMGCWYT